MTVSGREIRFSPFVETTYNRQVREPSVPLERSQNSIEVSLVHRIISLPAFFANRIGNIIAGPAEALTRKLLVQNEDKGEVHVN